MKGGTIMTQNERLSYLLKYLINESANYSDLKIPCDINEQKRLLRSLMNVRTASAASNEFLSIQNDYLKTEIENMGITDSDSFNDRLCIWQGDITTLKCEAIVNAANSRMLGCFIPCHRCIDNAIHTFSGIQLRNECNEIMNKRRYEAETGEAIITSAYNLPCNYVIHTVGPIVGSRLTAGDCEKLALCYKNCLRLADENNIKSIAFCCISTGEFHFPNDKAAEIAVETVTEYLKNSEIKRVIFNVFKDTDREIYEKLVKA